MTNDKIHTAARHFCIAALWADCEEGTSPRITKEARDWAFEFIKKFAMAYPEYVNKALVCEGYGRHPDAGSPEAAFGHDLYLTARGHGVGFSDREELGKVGEQLHQILTTGWRSWQVEPDFYRGWLYFI